MLDLASGEQQGNKAEVDRYIQGQITLGVEQLRHFLCAIMRFHVINPSLTSGEMSIVISRVAIRFARSMSNYPTDPKRMETPSIRLVQRV